MYHLAQEFHTQGLIVATTLFKNTGLLLEQAQVDIKTFSEDTISHKQTLFIEHELWDETIYSRLHLAVIYLDLISLSAIHTTKKSIDLNKEFKKVVPNITFHHDKFLSGIKIKQCEEVINSIFKKLLSTENYPDFRKIVELLFVSKLAHHCASLMTRNDANINSLKEEIYKIFPQFATTFNAFFASLNPQVLSPKLSSQARTLSLLKETMNEPKKNAITSAKRKEKNAKKNKQPTNFSERKRHAPPTNLAKHITHKIPEHIAILVNDNISLEEEKESSVSTELAKPKLKNNHKKKKNISRRQAYYQSNANSSLAPCSSSSITAPELVPEAATAPALVVDTFKAETDQSETLTPVNIAPIKVPDPIKRLIALFKSLGSKHTAIVGGYVRDQLLNRNCSETVITNFHEYDYDLVTDLPIKGIKEKYPELFSAETFSDEYTSLNFEGYKIDLKFSPNLANSNLCELEAYQHDARTRDFTCNVLYANEDGTVFDPLNVGIDGLKEVCLIVIPRLHGSTTSSHSNTTQDMRQSFSEDPIRMFRAIHATSMRELQLSEEMNAVLLETVPTLKEYFCADKNLGKINSLIHKLLCRASVDENFYELQRVGFLSVLFPALDTLLKSNKSFESWIIHELKNPPAKPSLNYIYAMFIVGMNLINDTHDSAFSQSELDTIENTIILKTPLLTKNFEKWPFKSLVQLAKSSWSKYQALNTSNTATVHHSMSASSIFTNHNLGLISNNSSSSAPPVNTLIQTQDFYRQS
jgi:tRNA nucleotidyltransferase/poly(A) polymerase